MELPKRIQSLDAIRVASMLSVVFVHSAAGSLRAGYGTSTWHFANVTTSIMSAAVPLFFMVSGALLLDSAHTLSIGYTLRRRIPRLLVPFLVWSLVAVAYYFLVALKVNGSADWAIVTERLRYLPSRPTAIALWFMYALIPLYILSPFIKRLVDSLTRGGALYLVGLWAFFSVLLPTIAAFVPGPYSAIFILDPKYNLSIMAGYAGYFVLGYYLMKMQRPIAKKWLGLVILGDTAAMTLGTWWKTTDAGPYSEVFKTYIQLFTVVMSVALFLLFKEWLRERCLRPVFAAGVQVLAPLAFGVYLVHNLLVDLISRLTGWSPAGSIPILIAYYVVVLAASVAVAVVLSAVKPLCWIFTGQRYSGWRWGRVNEGSGGAPQAS